MEKEVVFKYSRASNKPIYFGKYIPLQTNNVGVPKFLIGPDWGFFVCLNFAFALGFFGMMISLSQYMSVFHFRVAIIFYIIQVSCYTWVFLSRPGLSTIDIIEFEEPLTNEQAE